MFNFVCRHNFKRLLKVKFEHLKEALFNMTLALKYLKHLISAVSNLSGSM